MKIYLDYIFIENIIVNFVIIYQVGIFTKTKISIKRNIISCFILSIYTVIMYILNDKFLSNVFIKLMITNITMYIAFKPSSLLQYLKKIVYYYINNQVKPYHE